MASKLKPLLYGILYITLLSSLSAPSIIKEIEPDRSSKEFIINVISYNIHHCNPPAKRGVIEIDSIASVIVRSGADIAFLQEVDKNVTRSGVEDQAALLATKSGLHYYHFYKAIDFMGGEYGVAILSRYPLKDLKNTPLDSPQKSEERVLGTAVVEIGDNISILLANTHLDLKPINRTRQITQIDSIIKDSPFGVILAGDFNATPESDQIQYLIKNYIIPTSRLEYTFPNETPDRTIDYIFIKNPGKDNHPTAPTQTTTKPHLEFVTYKVLHNINASDHLPIIAQIRINL